MAENNTKTGLELLEEIIEYYLNEFANTKNTTLYGFLGDSRINDLHLAYKTRKYNAVKCVNEAYDATKYNKAEYRQSSFIRLILIYMKEGLYVGGEQTIKRYYTPAERVLRVEKLESEKRYWANRKEKEQAEKEIITKEYNAETAKLFGCTEQETKKLIKEMGITAFFAKRMELQGTECGVNVAIPLTFEEKAEIKKIEDIEQTKKDLFWKNIDTSVLLCTQSG